MWQQFAPCDVGDFCESLCPCDRIYSRNQKYGSLDSFWIAVLLLWYHFVFPIQNDHNMFINVLKFVGYHDYDTHQKTVVAFIQQKRIAEKCWKPLSSCSLTHLSSQSRKPLIFAFMIRYFLSKCCLFCTFWERVVSVYY